MVSHYPITVIALLHPIDKKDKPKMCWDIAINRKSELIKLPVTDFPVTIAIDRRGNELVLSNGKNICEVSFHRRDDKYKSIWINSATIRKNGDEKYTDSYHNFIKTLGIDVGKSTEGIRVGLAFTSKTQASITRATAI